MGDPVTFLKECVKRLLLEYETLNTEWSKVELLFDDERMHYMAVRIGWFREKHIHRCLVHIDIIDGEIVIQANNTEHALDEELIEMGVPAEKIQIGFLPPAVRALLKEETAQEKMEVVQG